MQEPSLRRGLGSIGLVFNGGGRGRLRQGSSGQRSLHPHYAVNGQILSVKSALQGVIMRDWPADGRGKWIKKINVGKPDARRLTTRGRAWHQSRGGSGSPEGLESQTETTRRSSSSEDKEKRIELSRDNT